MEFMENIREGITEKRSSESQKSSSKENDKLKKLIFKKIK
jgi:hypothetical protein